MHLIEFHQIFNALEYLAISMAIISIVYIVVSWAWGFFGWAFTNIVFRIIQVVLALAVILVVIDFIQSILI